MALPGRRSEKRPGLIEFKQFLDIRKVRALAEARAQCAGDDGGRREVNGSRTGAGVKRAAIAEDNGVVGFNDEGAAHGV